MIQSRNRIFHFGVRLGQLGIMRISSLGSGNRVWSARATPKVQREPGGQPLIQPLGMAGPVRQHVEEVVRQAGRRTGSGPNFILGEGGHGRFA